MENIIVNHRDHIAPINLVFQTFSIASTYVDVRIRPP